MLLYAPGISSSSAGKLPERLKAARGVRDLGGVNFSLCMLAPQPILTMAM
jgi:hypothetical protein